VRASRHILVLVLPVLSVLGGCSAGRGAVRLEGAMPSPVRNAANEERLQNLLVQRQSPEDSSEYRISLGDLLSVTIHAYRPRGGDFLSDVRVDEAGQVSLPMITPVRAAGLTIAEFRQALADALQQADVIRQPMITVSLKEYLGRQVVVLGAVSRPGRYTLSRGQEQLIDVLSMAGGLLPTAGNYLILRPKPKDSNGSDISNLQVAYALGSGQDGKTPLMGSDDGIVLPLGTGTAGADSSLVTLPVRGGDVIMIPEAGQAFVEGKVDKPGVYQLRHGMTLSQLLANAGGTTFPAKRSKIELVRSSPFGESSQWLIDLDRIRDQQLNDVLLEPNDRVVVPANAIKMVPWGIYQLALSIVRVSVGGALSVF
jgi:polysaccharide export outer membrane protein